MKDATKFCVLLAIALVSHTLYANTISNDVSETPVNEEHLEENRPLSGMFFTSAYVVEEYEYDDAYCLLYDDADMNLFNAEICVDLKTYQLVCQAIKENRELVGALVLNEDCSFGGVQVFTLVPDTECEANRNKIQL